MKQRIRSIWQRPISEHWIAGAPALGHVLSLGALALAFLLLVAWRAG